MATRVYQATPAMHAKSVGASNGPNRGDWATGECSEMRSVVSHSTPRAANSAIAAVTYQRSGGPLVKVRTVGRASTTTTAMTWARTNSARSAPGPSGSAGITPLTRKSRAIAPDHTASQKALALVRSSRQFDQCCRPSPTTSPAAAHCATTATCPTALITGP